MSEASWRLSWFISSSYSKSEIARRPLTIDIAPLSRAKSTISLSKVSTRTLGRCDVADAMNPQRSSALNSVLVLRTEALTTATTSSSNIGAARLMMSTCPFVTGSYEPGQTAMRLSGAMDANQGVAVAAFVVQGKIDLQRRPAIALHDHRSLRCHHGRERPRQVAPQGGGQPVWRIEEDDIVLTRAARCSAEVPAHLGADHLGLGSERLEVGRDGADGGRRVVHEGGMPGAARQCLDAQRARAGEQVQHVSVLDRVAQDREQRLADAVRSRPGLEAGGDLQPAAPVDARDHAHCGRMSRRWTC